MRRWSAFTAALLLGSSSCGTVDISLPPVETEFSIVNLSRQWYAVLRLRTSASIHDPSAAYWPSNMISPGGVLRERFSDALPDSRGCPDRVDLQIYLYQRVHSNTPIGLDPGESLDPVAVASSEMLDVAACEAVVLSTFTIVILDSIDGQGTIRIAQGSAAETEHSFVGRGLAELPQLPPLLSNAPIEGAVVSLDGQSVEGIGILIRTRVRSAGEAPECCFSGPTEVDEVTSCCYGDPIVVSTTDDAGRFRFDRPPGAYWVEVFADGLLFRPPGLAVESPIDNITFVVETVP